MPSRESQCSMIIWGIEVCYERTMLCTGMDLLRWVIAVIGLLPWVIARPWRHLSNWGSCVSEETLSLLNPLTLALWSNAPCPWLSWYMDAALGSYSTVLHSSIMSTLQDGDTPEGVCKMDQCGTGQLLAWAALVQHANKCQFLVTCHP